MFIKKLSEADIMTRTDSRYKEQVKMWETQVNSFKEQNKNLRQIIDQKEVEMYKKDSEIVALNLKIQDLEKSIGLFF